MSYVTNVLVLPSLRVAGVTVTLGTPPVVAYVTSSPVTRVIRARSPGTAGAGAVVEGGAAVAGTGTATIDAMTIAPASRHDRLAGKRMDMNAPRTC
ncbi:hypothetical protein GCM10023334_043970 [Nonomuraea thailandensis]